VSARWLRSHQHVARRKSALHQVARAAGRVILSGFSRAAQGRRSASDDPLHHFRRHAERWRAFRSVPARPTARWSRTDVEQPPAALERLDNSIHRARDCWNLAPHRVRHLVVLGVDDAQHFFGGQRVDLRRSRIPLFGEKFFEPRHGSILTTCVSAAIGTRAIIVVNRGPSMPDKAQLAVDKFAERYNCAQSIMFAFCDECGLSQDVALKVACGFGAGMGRKQEVCGAVAGGVMVLGLRRGRGARDPRSVTEDLYPRVREFMDAFAARNGSYLCRDLLPAAS